MTDSEMLDRLVLARSILREVDGQMNTRTTTCKCCGVSVRENLDDFNGSQALFACLGRIDKMIERLQAGQWKGREVAPVVDASRLRGGG